MYLNFFFRVPKCSGMFHVPGIIDGRQHVAPDALLFFSFLSATAMKFRLCLFFPFLESLRNSYYVRQI